MAAKTMSPSSWPGSRQTPGGRRYGAASSRGCSGATGSKMAKLVISLDGRIVGNYFLDQPSFTIGSLDDNDLCLAAPGISRFHARIVSIGNDDILEDANSANGTLVNGNPIATHILQQDDVIENADYRIRY